MIKKILYVFIVFTATLHSQNVVKGSLELASEKYTWVALYQLKGSKQLYITDTNIKNGDFEMTFPENASSGMYRLMYDMENKGIVDFIYNNESVHLKFNPLYPSEMTTFLSSEENSVYFEYKKKSTQSQRNLSQIQLTYFKESEEKKQVLIETYKIELSIYENIQQEYESKSLGKLAHNFIKSSRKYYAPNLINTPQEYLNSEKTHYFDFINFEDTVLLNSIFFSEKVIDYVFYLNTSDDVVVQNSLYKKALHEVVERIGANNNVKAEMLTTLLYVFAQTQNAVLVEFVLDNYYNNLPSEYVNQKVITEVKAKIKLAIGQIAPDFSWQENRVTKKLSELNNAATYVLVFWSTSCSHCLDEIPQLYEFTKDAKNIHVIGFTLENDAVGFNKHTSNLKKWTNILGLKKWQNPIARTYEINSTPTYFILDKNKRIIAKPEFFKDVKAYFER